MLSDFHSAREREAIETITGDGSLGHQWTELWHELADAEQGLGDATAELETYFDGALTDEAIAFSRDED
jgi:hypothetical protein